MATRWQDLRQAISGTVIDKGLSGLSRLASLHPRARPARYGVEVVRDVDFGGELLDVYRPREASGDAIPVLYLHGGGFRILSKDTHWAMALAFAARRRPDGRRYVVFVPNYRLAPRHPFPAAVEDAARALLWVADHAPRYGADPELLVVAGESAGANLTVALGIARAWSRPEPYARRVFDAAPPMRALLPACGIFQVSDARHRGTPEGWVLDRIRAISEGYLPRGGGDDGRADLADVVPFLERGPAPARALPPLFAIAGGRDPVLPDSERLTPAWQRHGGDATHAVYPDGIHTFHAFVWTPLARRAWRDQHAFLERVVR
ncbi:MAG: alpha/beta hydrolase [Deltaproteobacteria bacterium]|nr:alpha/beta hydrolase [Deltaproteobacteria bacterium]